MDRKTLRVRELAAEHNLHLAELGALLGRTRRTARAWMSGARVIPDHALALLEIRLAQRSSNQTQGAA